MIPGSGGSRVGVTILEADVPPGDYVLFRGPPRIMHGDGDPARVLLTDRMP